MKKLYIIGNGFDLMHGLPTQYIKFKEYCNDRIDDYLNYLKIDMSDDSAWSRFEEVLGYFNGDQYYDDNCDNREAESWSEAAGVADEIAEAAENLVDLVKSEFYDWVKEINLNNTNQKTHLDPSALYLNFNYTSTLQIVYKIPNERIEHIHGHVDAGSDLIFGHGMSIEEESEIDENGDSNRHPYTDAENAAQIPLYTLKKKVFEIMESKAAFFNSLSQIDKVVVIGHSLNDIDLPYFNEVNLKSNQPDWTIYYYNDGDYEIFRNKMRSMNISESKVILIDIKQSTQQGDALKSDSPAR